MTITIGSPSRDREGRHGVVARLTTDAGGWHGVYHLPTHGMSADEVSAERDRLEAWHERKAAKLAELNVLIGQRLGAFVITDATVRDRGHGCEVVCRARSEATVIEYREFFDDPSHVGHLASVRFMLQATATLHNLAVESAEEHVADVAAALGLA